MNAKVKMWVQLAGALFFAALAVVEGLGLKTSSFGAQWGPYILVFGCAVMLFEAWRTWRSQVRTKKEQTE